METSRTAIVILNWNGKQETIRCLQALSDCGSLADADLFLLDNGSRTDETPALRPHAPADASLWRVENNLGFSAGINHCLRRIRAERPGQYGYFLLLNNDTEPGPLFLEKLVEIGQSDPRIGILGPTVLRSRPSDSDPAHESSPPLTTGWIRWWTGQTPFSFGELTTPFAECELVHGCCFLFKAELLDGIGDLDEDYFAYYEETDFCVQARRAGYRIGVARDSRVFHAESVSVNRVSGMQEYLMMRNRLLFSRKRASRAQFLCTLAYCTLIYGPRRWLRALIKRQPRAAGAVLRGWRHGLTGETVTFP